MQLPARIPAQSLINPNDKIYLSTDEMRHIFQLLRASVKMLRGIAEAEPVLRAGGHPLAAQFYSMSREYPYTLDAIQKTLRRHVR